jgi:hypothetical protein
MVMNPELMKDVEMSAADCELVGADCQPSPVGAALLARVDAAERTPAIVLRAMLRAYEDEWLDLETKLRCYVRGEGPLTLADRHNLEAFRETVPALRGITAEVLSGSPFDPGQTFGRYVPTTIGADYAARLAGTTPLDAPPRRAP